MTIKDWSWVGLGMALVTLGVACYLAWPRPFRCTCDQQIAKPYQFDGVAADYRTCLSMCAAFGPPT